MLATKMMTSAITLSVKRSRGGTFIFLLLCPDATRARHPAITHFDHWRKWNIPCNRHKGAGLPAISYRPIAGNLYLRSLWLRGRRAKFWLLCSAPYGAP